MIGDLRHRFLSSRLWIWVGVAIVLLGAAYFGSRASVWWLALLVVSLCAVVLIQQPILGLLALVPAALAVSIEFGTGTAVTLNAATLLMPALLALWGLDMARRQELHLVPSRTTRPLLLFLLAGLFSFLVGNALWDPAVPRSWNFAVIQLAQWAIFVFSAGAFWMAGNLIRDEIWLQRLAFFFLAIGGSLALLLVLPQVGVLVYQIVSFALHRAPFWLLLTALACGQLLFNQDLSTSQRLFLLATLGAMLIYTFRLQRETASIWVGVGAVAGVLAWLRWPRLRWLAVAVLLVLVATGFLFSTVYEFAGGQAEWEESGGSRLSLIGRVVEVTMRNPITGLGPAAYRAYTRMKPLSYGRAFYIAPNVSSHNNYVDLFSHVGLLGLGLFFWFAAELAWLGFRLRAYFTKGFAAGYVNAMLAAWVGSLVVMLLGDWILPFVYNIGFPGFQASVLVWLFLGGLVALEQMAKSGSVC